MNEHPPLEPVGDASLEARIVAWVLGEATAFEAGELERLCDERPELLVFRRRMRALHGLLSEAESAEADEAWKLPPDKRAKIEELFGESTPEQDIPILRPAPPSRSLLKPGRLHQRRRSEGPAAPSRWFVKTILTAAACVMFGMLYRFGFDATKSSSILALNEKSVDFMPSGGGGRITAGNGVGIIGGSTFEVAPASRASRPRVVPSGSDESGLQAGQKQNLQAAEGGISYKTKAAQAVADTESLAAASKPQMEIIREFKYSNEYEPPELPNSVAFSGKVLDRTADPFAANGGAVDSDADPFASADAPAEKAKLAANRPVYEPKPGAANSKRVFAEGAVSDLTIPDPGENFGEISSLSSFEREKGGSGLGVGSGGGFGANDDRDGRRVEIEGESASRDRVIRREVPTSPTGETGAAFGGGRGGAMLEADEAVLSELTKNGAGNLELSGGNDYNGRTQATAGVLGIEGKDSGEMADSTKGEKSPISGGQDDTSILTGGLRSGDAAISRNSIDSVLNNPNRSSGLSPAGPPADKPGEASGELADLQSLKPAMPAAQPAPAPAAVAPPKPEAPKEKMMSDGIVWSDPDSPKKTSEDSAIDGKNSPEEGITYSHWGFAQREISRRQNSVTEGDRLLTEGRDAYSKGDYQQASEKYKKALEAVPDAPMLADRRESYTDHLSDANVALAQQYRKVGKYEEARALLGEVLKPGADPENADAKRELAWLEDPIRTNSALTYEFTGDVDKVRKNLYMAEGNLGIGKFDDAKRDYENVLRTDPYNSAARRGLEKIASAKSDYYRAAYDHTRAQLLMEVDKDWELTDAKDSSPTEMFESPLRGEKMSPKKEDESQDDARQQILKEVDKAWGLVAPSEAKPAPAPVPIPTDELSANAEAFSTFSLHVSDASFKVAKAALDRGERPDPESVRPEEFYNAFDYGDPTPAPGEPVACAIEQAAHPILPQRNLVRVAMRTGAAGRAASQPLNLTVLLDHSGSMEREDRHEGLNQAIVQLASLLKAGDTITVAGFSRTPRLMADRLPGERAKELVDIVRNTPSEGGTNLEEALKLGGDLALRQKNPAAQNRIVLLTDGAANLGNAKPEDLAERIRALRQQGISFDAAGLGAGGVNDRMLETLTRDGNGRYYLIDQPSDADANFAKQLAGAFRPAAENVKVQVHFNPARVGRYKLIGFEKHRLKTEDFRNDKVDAAELAAEEAGVAIYQVETLPQGTGEIGEASVRFKDTSTGQMVEQSWTIPYDEKAAAFDQAAPSMQLASLAALSAEKLRGGPLAEAIDFQSLTPQVAKVRAHYSTSKKVGDLIEMIGKLK
jgi:autotransporter-associated beta strand protein